MHRRNYNLARSGWCALAALLCIHCQSLKAAAKPPVPVPPWASSLEVLELPDGRVQLSFTSTETYPSHKTRDFYGAWAEEHGWRLIPPSMESWSSDQWQSFIDATSGGSIETDMWPVHWRSPDGFRSLRLTMLYQGDRTEQTVYVVLSPFYNLDEIEDPDALDSTEVGT